MWVLTDVDETAIRRGISQLFSNRKNDDLVLLYFSGHGVTDSRNDFYLSGISTDKNDLLPTAVSSDYVQKAMNQRGSKHQVLILDCCHSGAFPKGMTAKDIGKVNLSPKLGGEGRAILTASDSTQYAFEQDGFELSLYTHFLIEGLRTGAADRDNDGNVTIDELYEYVRDKVKSVNDLMSPEFYPVKEGHRIILARAVQDDPALKFRKEISEIIDLRKGKIFPSTRQLIVNAQIKHRVNNKVALEIEKELLKPYLEYENNLNAYKKMLRDMSAHEFPFSEVTQLEIEKCEIDFGLRREDIEKSKRDVESVENKCEETINLKPVESKLFDSKKIKVVVAIQLNASQAGYAYAFTNDKRIMLRTYWDKQPFNRFFTLPHLLYTPDGKIEAWGYAASSRLAELRQLKSTKGYSFFSSFMLLVQESRSHNLDGKPLVIGSDGRKFAVIDLIADYLTQLKNLILGDIGNSTILPLHTNSCYADRKVRDLTGIK